MPKMNSDHRPEVREALQTCEGLFDLLEQENRITYKVDEVDVRKYIQSALSAPPIEPVGIREHLKWALGQISHYPLDHDYERNEKSCDICKHIQQAHAALAAKEADAAFASERLTIANKKLAFYHQCIVRHNHRMRQIDVGGVVVPEPTVESLEAILNERDTLHADLARVREVLEQHDRLLRGWFMKDVQAMWTEAHEVALCQNTRTALDNVQAIIQPSRREQG